MNGSSLLQIRHFGHKTHETQIMLDRIVPCIVYRDEETFGRPTGVVVVHAENPAILAHLRFFIFRDKSLDSKHWAVVNGTILAVAKLVSAEPFS